MHEDLIARHIGILRTLQSEKGLFLASAQGVSTGYDKAWLRDNFYTALAFEYAGDWETVHRTYRAILGILLQHEEKIVYAATVERPTQTYQYIHARYNPETFDEYWEEWGNKQTDAVGAILWKIADLEEKGKSVFESEEEKRIVQRLVDYLAAIEYWHDTDSGMWEEWEELHASSIAAALAGLKKVRDLSNKGITLATVPEHLIENGENALRLLLPRESKDKFVDLSLLSLLYPYEVVSPEDADIILKNVEYHLVKRRGLIRYKGDKYYNKNEDRWSEEAEWVFGFSWLSIIYSRRGEKEKAEHYLEKTKECLTPEGMLPELYYSNTDTPNENIPLGWTESLFVVAMKEFERCFGA